MSKIWSFIMIISIISSFAILKPNIVTEEIMLQSQSAIENIIKLAGMICFWSGIFKILEKSKHIKNISKLIKKVIYKLFNKDELTDEVVEYMSLNVATNMLGVGNASTVSGIKAMEEMQKKNKKNDEPTNSMLLFLIINTASLQIIPTNMIALRTLYGSSNPTAVILPVWIVSVTSIIVGIFLVKILIKKGGR